MKYERRVRLNLYEIPAKERHLYILVYINNQFAGILQHPLIPRIPRIARSSDITFADFSSHLAGNNSFPAELSNIFSTRILYFHRV
jgi:hypothetical protein